MKFKKRHGPEYYIRAKLIRLLESKGWLVEIAHGNAYQTGFPDLYISHPQFGQRWIDVKNPQSYEFTNAQKRKWPMWKAAGVGIWILTADTESEYNKLFQPPNWEAYWKPRYSLEKQEIERLLDEIN